MQLVSAYWVVHHRRPRMRWWQTLRQINHQLQTPILLTIMCDVHLIVEWWKNRRRSKRRISSRQQKCNNANNPKEKHRGINSQTFMYRRTGIKNQNLRRFFVRSTCIHSESGMPYPAAVNPLDTTIQPPQAMGVQQQNNDNNTEVWGILHSVSSHAECHMVLPND